MRLSLSMIVRDEAARLPDLLDSVADVCDEMVVLDTGSKDGTCDVAREHGAKVFEEPWQDHFGGARNRALDHCNGDWILWLDADDVVPPATRRELAALKERLTDDVDAVVGPYHSEIGDDGTPLLIRYTHRLLRRRADVFWEGSVYEHVEVAPGKSIPDALLIVEHRPDPQRRAVNDKRRMAMLESAVASGDQSPAIKFNYGNQLYDRGLFNDAVLMYRQYLAADQEGSDRYWALVYMAECLDALGDATGVRDAASRAIIEDPSRAEAFVTLGRLYFAAGEWAEALPLFTAAGAARRPPYGLVRNADYVHAPWDYLSVCYEKLGRYEESLTAAMKALGSNPQADRVRENMRWVIGRL